MKRQINLILYLLPFLIILISQCSEIKGCKDQCKNKTRDCIFKNQLVSRAITTSVGGSSSSASTGRTTTGNEVEPNDTFQDSYKSSSNAIGTTTGNSFILTGTISPSTDIDIFDSGNASGGTRTLTQTNSLDKVTCNVYLKNNTLERGFVSRLQTPTSTPDSSFGFQGKLNPSFTFSYVTDGALVYIICSGIANTSYSIKVDATASTGSTSSSTSLLSSYTDYSFISSCTGATKTCETKCSRSF